MIVYKVEALALLKVKLAEAQKVDVINLANHLASHATIADKRREFLEKARKVAKDDRKLAEFTEYWPRSEPCPISYADQIQTEIDAVNMIAEDKFQVRAHGSLINALNRTYVQRKVC